MFGLIISGRPVDATPQAITETQYAFKIVQGQNFNHIVVFILPGTQLPVSTAAAVYIQISPAQGFKLLGAIGPGKESAIFKVSGLKANNVSGAAADGDVDLMTDDAGVGGAAATGEIIIGVSVEPAAQVESQLATLGGGSAQSTLSQTSNALVKVNASPANKVTTKILAQRIIGNAFNFLASFGSDTVPLKAFQDWWVKFEKKVELDPSFLEREQ